MGKNARPFRSFEKNGCPTLVVGVLSEMGFITKYYTVKGSFKRRKDKYFMFNVFFLDTMYCISDPPLVLQVSLPPYTSCYL